MRPRSPLLLIADHILQCLEADSCAIYESSGPNHGGGFLLAASVGGDHDSCPQFELAPSPGKDWKGFTSFAAFKRYCVRTDDVTQSLHVSIGGTDFVVSWDGASCELAEPGPMLAQPICRGDQVLGVVRVVRRKGKQPFQDADVAMLGQAIAPLLAVSFAQEQARTELVAGLLNIARIFTPNESHLLGRVGDEDAMLQAIVREAERLVRSRTHAAAVFMRDPSGAFVFRAPSEIGEKVERKRYETGDAGLTPAVLSGKVSYILSGNLPKDTEPGGRLSSLGHESKAAEIPGGQTMSFVAVPIHATLEGRSEVIGVIRVSSSQKYAFSHRDVETLRALADQTTHILQMLRRLRERDVLFETLVDTFWLPIIAVDNCGVITVCNTQAQKVLGLTESPIGRDVVQIAFGGNRVAAGAIKSAIKDAAREGGSLRDHYTLVYRHCPDSSLPMPIPLRMRAAFLREAGSGEVTGTIGILEDVAAQNRNETCFRIGRRGVTADVRIARQLERIARSRSCDSVLVTGENGTGKGLVVEDIHRRMWPERELFTISSAGLAAELLESELFGVCEGAFTGATKTKHGIFRPGSKICVFLDDLQDLSLECQAKILRVVQEGKVRKVGSAEEENVDAKLFVATWDDLMEAVGRGSFRRDLYHRLVGVTVTLPPLRERSADIMLLADHFLRQAAERHEVHIVGFRSEVIRSLLAYSWPGNVRELYRMIDSAVWQCRVENYTGKLLDMTFLPPHIADAEAPLMSATGSVDLDSHGGARQRNEAAGHNGASAVRLPPSRLVPPESCRSAMQKALFWDANDPSFRSMVRDRESLVAEMDARGFRVGRTSKYEIWSAILAQRSKSQAENENPQADGM